MSEPFNLETLRKQNTPSYCYRAFIPKVYINTTFSSLYTKHNIGKVQMATSYYTFRKLFIFCLVANRKLVNSMAYIIIEITILLFVNIQLSVLFSGIRFRTTLGSKYNIYLFSCGYYMYYITETTVFIRLYICYMEPPYKTVYIVYFHCTSYKFTSYKKYNIK